MQSMAFMVDVFIQLCNFINRNLLLKQLAIIVSRKISHSARIAALSINFAIRALSVFIYLSQANKGAPLCASNLMLRAAADMQRQFAIFCGAGVCGFSPFHLFSAATEFVQQSNQILFPLSTFSQCVFCAWAHSVSFFSSSAGGRCVLSLKGLEHALLCKSAPRSI
jgi:hypothetical protein